MNDEELIAPKISTAAIEMLALECDDEAREWASMQLEPMFERIAASLRALAAERDAQAAEIERLQGAMQEAIRLAEQPHYGNMSDALDQWFDAIEVLRTTLAELTGGKDE